jgi:hypothetical protein
MFTGTIELEDTNSKAHLLNKETSLDVHFVQMPKTGDSFRFFVQSSPWVTSYVILVEIVIEDGSEVRYIHTRNSTYKLSDLDGDEYENDSEIDFEFEFDDEL